MDNLRFLSFSALFCIALAVIRINELKFPPPLQHGKVNSVVLDCKFEVDDTQDIKGLVIQWFFQENDLIYQWLPGGRPKPLGLFKDRIDINYKASNESISRHRALKITNLTTDLTGEYKCKVSNYETEASRAQKMVIFEPPKVFVFDHFENTSTLLCMAYDTFPKPTISVFASNINLTRLDDVHENDNEENDILQEEYEDNVEEAYGFYNVSSSFQYDPSEIVEPIEFICKLTIPDTNYAKVLRKMIAPEGETTSTTEQYDYETSTVSVVIAENSGYVKIPNPILFSATALIFFWRHL